MGAQISAFRHHLFFLFLLFSVLPQQQQIMPHLVSNRPRRYFKTKLHPHLPHFDFELVNFSVYLVGGLIFLVGSVLFLPLYEEYEGAGAWLFVVGSFLFLTVAVHDIFEATRAMDKEWREKHIKTQHHISAWCWIEYVAATLYFIAAILFVVGSFLFVPDYANFIAGSWLFIVGSGLYASGAIINMAQIYLVQDALMIQFQMITAAQFLVGSILFLVGSIIYLFEFDTADDFYLADTYAGGIFIAGGVCFTGGGISNGMRIWYAKKKFKKRKEVNGEL